MSEEDAQRCASPVDNNDPIAVDREESGVSTAKNLATLTATKSTEKHQAPLLVRVSSIDDEEQDSDHGIVPATLEVVTISRRQWIRPHEPPPALPTASDTSPILQELTRSWRVLRLKPAHPMDGIIKKKELSADQTLLKNYEPRFSTGDATFPCDIQLPGYLQPRVAVEDAAAYLVTPRLRFTLGMIEPLYCRVMIYDVQLGCRITEEFSFVLPPSPSTGSSYRKPRHALFYTLPNHSTQHLYIVLKVSKCLMGDADTATAPYCNPEKFTSDLEQQRLIERTTDGARRLGRYQQPLAWGAINLAEGANRSMTLYRQRVSIGDEQRLLMITEAARGQLKEKLLPCVCELDVERIEEKRLEESKFQLKSLRTLGKETLKLPTCPILDIVDPFTAKRTVSPQQAPPVEDEVQADAEAATFYDCREVQPLCHPSAIASYGLHGSGPIATNFVHAMYLYPTHLERFQFRNVAVRVQLLQNEVEFVCGIDDHENQNAFVRAFYGPEQEMQFAAFTEVNYHQKNPQFEKEIKLVLPEQLTASHHLLFTFYHVHCKKLQPNQQQQELVGCAWMPILSREGALVEDSDYVLNVLPPPVASKNSTSGGIISLPPGYLDAARNTSQAADSSKTTSFSCRTRTLSSVRSQDPRLAAFLEPFQSKPLQRIESVGQDHVLSVLNDLRRVPHDTVRHFFMPVMRFLLAYIRFGAALVRQTAFRALLSVLDRVFWSPANRFAKPPQDVNQLLLHFVSLAFDDRVVESCACRIVNNSPGTTGERRPQSTVQAIIIEWLRVLKDKTASDDDAKKVSLCYSNIFLQLILKAMTTTAQKTDKTLLPLRVDHDDDLLIEDLLLELVENTTNALMGLLIQKEVNLSIATFCRGLFLVAKSLLPIRIITHFLGWTQRLQGDVNVTVHILFPFLNCLIEFEFFAVVNGFHASSTSERTRGGDRHRGAWLARMIFERLLRVVDEQVEDRVRSEALRLLRRMFVAHVYNPRHQTAEQQELIALMYFPMIPTVARFTTDGKLLAASAALAETNQDAGESDRSLGVVFRKELLICIAHLLSSVTLPYVSWYFRQSALVVASGNETMDKEGTATVALSPTASLMHYRRLVEETKLRASDGRRQSLIQRNLDKAFANGSASSRLGFGSIAYDEVRVHACLSLVRQIIEVFLLGDEAAVSSSCSSGISSLHILSPDLVPRDGRVSLLELEAHLKQRRSRHRVGSVGQDAVVVASRASSTAAAAGSKSPNAKLGSTSGSFTSPSTASAAPPRLSTQKSLPRTWGKNYVNSQQQQRVSLSGSGDKTTSTTPANSRKSCGEMVDLDGTNAATNGEEYESNTQNLHRIIADTTLKALRTAVDQFEWVLRVIEVPLDYKTNAQRRPSKNKMVSMDQAFSLLGSLVDIFFLLMKRASSIECLCTAPESEIDEETNEDADCFLADLFCHLHTFVLRFQKALFATRVTGLPLIHDQSRVFLLVSLSATAKLSSVRQLAASLLCRLIRVCYEQTGSFLLIKRPIITVFCANFFSTSALQIPTLALRDGIELWRDQSLCEEQQTQESKNHSTENTFALQFGEMLDNLASQIKVFETWHEAMTMTQSEEDRSLDYEELEDGLYRVVQSVSSLWLADVKSQWMDALVQLHAARSQFEEATCCTLENTAFRQEESSHKGTPHGTLVAELRSARELAQKANWHEKVVDISERLLATLRQANRFPEYQETLRVLDFSIQQLADSHQNQHGDQFFAFYRVVFAGDCVPRSISMLEFIYKRTKFVSLGEFVGEMKAILRAKFPVCDRVDILPESKPLPPLDRHPNVVFMRVTNVELVQQDPQTTAGSEFKFSTPFTLNGATSYGKTAEQMKRVTFLTTPRAFPCPTRRQVVSRRREVVRCPIDNSMDDIRKRCGLLQDEIGKEVCGRTDLKTLTLVLKGSVDTHVHGGVPEVIDAFLTTSAVLVDVNGIAMSDEKSTDKREELADLVVEFLELCWTCLLISRLAFRRVATTPAQTTASFTNGDSNAVANPANPSPNKSILTSQTNTTNASSSNSGASSISRVLATLGLPLVEDDVSFSPLQVEFEKGFAILVDQMRSKVTFAYPRDNDLAALDHHVQNHRRPRTASLKSIANPLPPPPTPAAPALLPTLAPAAVSSSVCMPPPAPVTLPTLPSQSTM